MFILSFDATVSLAFKEYTVMISNKNVPMKSMCKLSFKNIHVDLGILMKRKGGGGGCYSTTLEAHECH